MKLEDLGGNLFDELSCGEEGFRIENSRNGRSVTVVEESLHRYHMAKGGMMAGLTNSETVAINFLYGG
jgi:hypothetical protein